MKKTKSPKSAKNKRSITGRSKQSSAISDIRENVVGTISEGFDRFGTEFTRATKSNSVRNAAWVIGGAAAGVALAYFLDPSTGKGRRSAITGKYDSLKQGVSDIAGEKINDLRGSLREYVAKGVSAVKANFMDRNEDSDFDAGDDQDSVSQAAKLPRSRNNSKNYSGYQDHTFSEQ